MASDKAKAMYYALDMPNGKTYIGKKVERKGAVPPIRLEELVVTETETTRQGIDAGSEVFEAVSDLYRRQYRKVAGRNPHALDSSGYIALPDMGGMELCRWYLGTGILE